MAEVVDLSWPATTRHVAYTWAALSNACQYHLYELGPTAAELKGWISNVRTLITQIIAHSAGARPRWGAV